MRLKGSTRHGVAAIHSLRPGHEALAGCNNPPAQPVYWLVPGTARQSMALEIALSASHDRIVRELRARRWSVSDADAAFEALLRRQQADLMRFACWLTGDRHVAEEVVQEALLRAWKSRHMLREDASIRSWLLTIVRREHGRLYERKRLPTVPLEDAMRDADPALQDSDNDDLAELRRAILALPQAYREPLLMQVIFGYSTEEIAREMGLTQSAVLTRLFRARNALRDVYALPRQDAPSGSAP